MSACLSLSFSFFLPYCFSLGIILSLRDSLIILLMQHPFILWT
jgi:hypothetical protein